MPHIRIPLRSQLLRPCLEIRPNLRHHTLRTSRFNSSSTSPKSSRAIVPYIWYTLWLAVGLGGGYTVRSFILPFPFPEPGSAADRSILQAQASTINDLNIVKELRAGGYSLHSDSPLEREWKEKSIWKELNINNVISDNGSAPAKQEGGHEKVTRTLTQQTMAGAGGLGVQRAFWNPATRELIAVVWFGGTLSGWPGLAHGGAIATVFDESMARVVAGPDISIGTLSYILDIPPMCLLLSQMQ